jgi:predicted dehydrogenase
MNSSAHPQVRFAVVGLGHFAQTAILPAFGNVSENAILSAIVTGDKEKAATLSQRYHVPAYSYDDYDSLMRSGDIDAVYIALPNSEHREYTERAARAGVHVLCEKPLAHTAEDAVAMVRACESAKVRLMTGYRLHFEEGNLQAIEAIRSGKIGEAKLFSSIHTMQVEPDNIRVDRSLGGGPLEDIGIYCINAARYLFGAEPEDVVAFEARSNDPRFDEVPESVSVTMRFSQGRLASFLCGFSGSKVSEYRVVGTEGILTMDPAYTWHDAIHQTVTIGEKETRSVFEHRDQIAAEILYFADCIQNGADPEPSGREGLIDVRIMEAIRISCSSRRAVRIEPIAADSPPKISQSIKRRPPVEPKPVNAESPSKS